MTIRTRLTVWFAAIMFVSVAATGVLTYYDLVVEPRTRAIDHSGVIKPSKEEEARGEFVEILAWGGILVPALALSLAGGWWLMRKTLAPIAALTHAAEQINERSLGAKLPRSGSGDEIDRLAEVFNAMTERLNDSFNRIREFTLHASHELKTPLTVIHGELETALQDEALSSPHRERLESELDEIQRLTKIVDGLTLLTKAGTGQVALARQPVRLEELAREACADAQSLARPHEICVTLAAAEDVTITGDRDRLRQLLLNLTDNAIKYNKPGGAVSFSLQRQAESAQITITNTGPGIAADLLPRVFEPFFRGDASHSQAVEGCGLGLSIARWIVTAHQGTIQLASTPGETTTATVRLPLA